MEKLELIAPCHFGLEAVLKREITDLGYEVAEVTDGKVSFYGDWAAVCYANVFLRTAERILVKAGSFHAESFEDLFQGTRAIPWEELIPKDGRFWVAKATSVKSRLFSPRDIQSIMKKAMVERMAAHYHLTQFPRHRYDGNLPAQAGIPAHDRESADFRDPCGGADYADSLEEGPDPGGSLLRIRHISD